MHRKAELLSQKQLKFVKCITSMLRMCKKKCSADYIYFNSKKVCSFSRVYVTCIEINCSLFPCFFMAHGFTAKMLFIEALCSHAELHKHKSIDA